MNSCEDGVLSPQPWIGVGGEENTTDEMVEVVLVLLKYGVVRVLDVKCRLGENIGIESEARSEVEWRADGGMDWERAAVADSGDRTPFGDPGKSKPNCVW